MFVQYSYILVAMIFGLIVKPYLLIREVNYNITDFTNCFKKTFTIFISSFILPFISFLLVDVNTIAGFILVGATSVLSVITVSYLFLPKKIKIMIPSLIKKKLGIRQ